MTIQYHPWIGLIQGSPVLFDKFNRHYLSLKFEPTRLQKFADRFILSTAPRWYTDSSTCQRSH